MAEGEEIACRYVGPARQPDYTVSLSYRKSRFFRIKKKNEEAIADSMRNGRIAVHFNSEVRVIRPSSVTLQTERLVEIANDVVTVQAVGLPPFGMRRTAGIAFGGDDLNVRGADGRMKNSARQQPAGKLDDPETPTDGDT